METVFPATTLPLPLTSIHDIFRAPDVLPLGQLPMIHHRRNNSLPLSHLLIPSYSVRIRDAFPRALITVSAPSPSPKSTAPGQYLGYALQPVRLCYHLLSCQNGANVSIEQIDDIAVTNPDGTVLLEQDKSALKQNPVADWSVDLWTTFSNWSTMAQSGSIDPQHTSFSIYVTPQHSGTWVQRFTHCHSRNETTATLNDFRKALDQRPRRSRSYPHITTFLSSDSDTLFQIISKFELRFDHDPVDPIRDILSITVPEAILDDCCAFAIGLAKETADNLIRAGAPATIASTTFRKEVRAFISKNNLMLYLPSFPDNPSTSSIEHTIGNQPVFVQQLNIVEMPHPQIMRAVSDLLRSAADKTTWAEKGLIANDSLEDFDQRLVRQYENRQIEVTDAHSELDPCAKGRLLYSFCASHDAKLDGREVPGHFVSGCYNDLADRRQVGWHPNFDQVLPS